MTDPVVIPNVNITQTNVSDRVREYMLADAQEAFDSAFPLDRVATPWQYSELQYSNKMSHWTTDFEAKEKVKDVATEVQVRNTDSKFFIMNKTFYVKFRNEDEVTTWVGSQVYAEQLKDATKALSKKFVSFMLSGYAAANVHAVIDATGTGGLTIEHFRTAKNNLNRLDVPSPRIALLSADAHDAVSMFDTVKNRDYQGDAAIAANRGQTLPNVQSFDPIMTNYLPVNDDEEVINFLMHPRGIIYASKVLESNTSAGVKKTILPSGLSQVNIQLIESYNDDFVADQATVKITVGMLYDHPEAINLIKTAA